MFPPVEEAVLRGNPKFAILYTNLTKNVLNSDGSSRDSFGKDQTLVKQELKTEQILSAKHQLLCKAVRDLDVSPVTPTAARSSQMSNSSQLPPEIIELILLVSSHLNAPPFDSSSQKLHVSTETWLSLRTHLPQIANLISSYLQTRALLLARILSPTTNPSYLHRLIPKVSSSVEKLQAQIKSEKEVLAGRRTAIVTKTLQVLEQYHRATSLSISHLEQTTHGALSRNLKAKSEYLAVQALTVSLLVKEKETNARKIVYTKQVQAALANYMQHLRVEQERARERRREAERILWGYGVGRDNSGEKERVMKEISRMYGVLKDELRSVERDVGRLRGK